MRRNREGFRSAAPPTGESFPPTEHPATSKSRDWRVSMTGLTRIAYALRTYSGLLIMMLGLVAQTAIAADAPQLTEAVLEVTLSDGEPGEMVVVLRGPAGQLYLEESDFARLRLRLPPTAPYVHEGRRFFDPKSAKGCTVTIDDASQRGVITARP